MTESVNVLVYFIICSLHKTCCSRVVIVDTVPDQITAVAGVSVAIGVIMVG